MNTEVASHGEWVLTPPAAQALLRLYHEGDSAFVSPVRSVLTRGAYAHLDAASHDQVAVRAERLLAEVHKEGEVEPLLIGALGFADGVPPRLVVPEGLVIGTGARGAAATSKAHAVPACLLAEVSHLPSAGRYCRNVTEALKRIQVGEFEKVVLSRALRVHAQVQAGPMLCRLMPRNLMGYTFAVDLGMKAAQARSTLVGASPELLLSKRGRAVTSHPLAGSLARSTDPREDQARAQRLLGSAKDHHEHTYVVDAIAKVLLAHCRKLTVPPRPSLVATATMWHLGTRIDGELNDPHASALSLALALHPTPAICGHPTGPARAFIEQEEGFERDFFAGLVGWVNAQGDGEWAVTIRCAEVADQHATVYAGAGIVQGSDPALELAETEAKMQTVLGAMNVALRREVG